MNGQSVSPIAKFFLLLGLFLEIWHAEGFRSAMREVRLFLAEEG